MSFISYSISSCMYNMVLEELYKVLTCNRAFNDVVCNDAVKCKNRKYGVADASDEALMLNTWHVLASSTIFVESSLADSSIKSTEALQRKSRC